MPSNTNFQKDVRQALNHLYNPEQLRKNPLLAWFGLTDRPDAPSVLQHTMTDAIQDLRPSQYEPLQSEARKSYEILLLRYIQQFSQPEVAHHIGVSERQFRREQDRAIDVLAEYVWKKYDTPERQAVKSAETRPTAIQPDTPTQPGDWDVEVDWGWIKTAYSERVSNTHAFISGVINLIQPVADLHHVVIRFNTSDKLPDLAMHPVALRQILLNVLRVAIAHALGGQVELDAALKDSTLDLQVIAVRRPIQAFEKTIFGQEGSLLEIAGSLMELCKGQLEFQEQPQGFEVRLYLPLVEGVSVLVVDDNRDIIELVRRYTTGTRYHITGLDDPDQIFAAIESSGAQDDPVGCDDAKDRRVGAAGPPPPAPTDQ